MLVGKYCTSFCQIAIILVIVAILAYIVYKNDSVNVTKETFENNQNEEFDRAIIKEVFVRYLEREPTEDEYLTHLKYITNDGDLTQLVAAVRSLSSANNTATPTVIKASSFPSTATVAAAQNAEEQKYKEENAKRFQAYKDTIDAYNRILQRMPTSGELKYYSNKLYNDGSFTVAQLEKLLYGSREYSIIEKNQSNLVNGELPGNVTDAQLRFDVNRIYQDVFGSQAVPTKEFEDFLKEKYKAYMLDEQRLRKLLLVLHEVDQDNVQLDAKGNIALGSCLVQSTSSQTPAQVPLVMEESELPVAQNPIVDAKSGGAVQYIYQSPNIINIISPSPEEMDVILQKLDQYELQKKETHVVKGAAPCYDKNKEKYADEFTTRLASVQKADNTGVCLAKSQYMLETQNRSRNALAEALNDRHFDDLRSACSRSSYYAQVDEEMEAAPKSSNSLNPQPIENTVTFGTPLTEAKKTSVGSIMPSFIYKELERFQ